MTNFKPSEFVKIKSIINYWNSASFGIQVVASKNLGFF